MKNTRIERKEEDKKLGEGNKTTIRNIFQLNKNIKERLLRHCRREAILPISVAPVLLSKKSYCCRGSASRRVS
uniref:Uncharacterized protein n=1 Tax=Romanomermis culicivorax TaxID=13658 RepID=A0A915I9R6_ROMCU